MIRHLLRRYPALRLQLKLALTTVLMWLAAFNADDESRPARERMHSAWDCRWAVRNHRRLMALRRA